MIHREPLRGEIFLLAVFAPSGHRGVKPAERSDWLNGIVGSEGNDRPLTVVHETWRSPELKVIVLSTDNDPRFGETTRKLTNINRSDPDPSLFLPPADYSVVEEKGAFTIKWGSEK